MLTKAGIDGNADYGTHSLRKSFCRQIYKGTGNDLNLTRAVMGHSSCSTTQKYLHVDEEEIGSAIMGLGAVIGASSVRLDPNGPGSQTDGSSERLPPVARRAR